MAFKTGYQRSTDDPRDIQAENVYGALALAAAPPETNWSKALPDDLGMMLNDRESCCTCSTIGHMVQSWSAQHGKLVTIPDAAVQAAYNLVNGGRDAGAMPRDVLNVMRGTKNNTSIGGHRIARYCRVRVGESKTIDLIEQSVWAMGGCYLGISLPRNWQDFSSWSSPSPRYAPDPNEGHALNILDYHRSRQQFILATWAKKVIASYSWVLRYLEEAWALLSPDWFGGHAKSPSGLILPDTVKVFQALAA